MRAVGKGLASTSVGIITAAALLPGADAQFSAFGPGEVHYEMGMTSGLLAIGAMIMLFIFGVGVGRVTAVAVRPAAREAVSPAIGRATGSSSTTLPPSVAGSMPRTSSDDTTDAVLRHRDMRRLTQLPDLKAQDARKELLNIYTQAELADALKRVGLPSSGLKADQVARLFPAREHGCGYGSIRGSETH